jgi:arylsulfate sulfotransferase
MKKTLRHMAVISGVVLGFVGMSGQGAEAAVVSSTSKGITPFLSYVTLTEVDLDKFTSVSFSITPKSGARSKPVSATFSKAYLQSRNYIHTAAKGVTVPVFGLYQNATNTVNIKILGGAADISLTTQIKTPEWENKTFTSNAVVVQKPNSVSLDYSFFMMKSFQSQYFPVILDIDGQPRWVGMVSGFPGPSTYFSGGAVYYGIGSRLIKMELDGTVTDIKDYYFSGEALSLYRRNIDQGKDGLLLHVDRAENREAVILEVDAAGKTLNTFDMNKIIEDAVVAGRENPAPLVRRNIDWLGINSATYWRAQDALVVSSRENFVIAIDYKTQKIKWILGDTTKFWGTYASLRKYALKLGTGSLAPIGQNAVSVTAEGELMLFDNGTASLQNPEGTNAGASRPYSAPRRYRINPAKMTAAMTWSFARGQTIKSPYMSSIYQDGKSYLIDYAATSGDFTHDAYRVVGLGKKDKIAFEYKYMGAPATGWNAQPVHLENLSFLK